MRSVSTPRLSRASRCAVRSCWSVEHRAYPTSSALIAHLPKDRPGRATECDRLGRRAKPDTLSACLSFSVRKCLPLKGASESAGRLNPPHDEPEATAGRSVCVRGRVPPNGPGGLLPIRHTHHLVELEHGRPAGRRCLVPSAPRRPPAYTRHPPRRLATHNRQTQVQDRVRDPPE